MLDGAFALCCFFAVVCLALLVSVHIITRDQTGVIGFQITPNESGFADGAVNFVSLFSDRIFKGRFNTFVSDSYLKVELLCSLVTAVLAAAAIRLGARPVRQAAFGNQLFSKKNARALTAAAGVLFAMAVVPAVIEMSMIASGDNMRGLYLMNGAVLAVIVYFMSLLTACGADMLPKGDAAIEDEDENTSGRTGSAVSKLGQNSRALSTVLWLGVAVAAAAAVWVIISMLPILPYISADAIIERDPADSIVLSMMLGTVDELQYTPVQLVVRYAWELASLVLAFFALISGCKVLGVTKSSASAFDDKAVRYLKKCGVLTLCCAIVLTGGSVVSNFLTGVRVQVPVCGFLCAAALFVCAKIVVRLGKLKEDEKKRELEQQEDLSDLNFILN